MSSNKENLINHKFNVGDIVHTIYDADKIPMIVTRITKSKIHPEEYGVLVYHCLEQGCRIVKYYEHSIKPIEV